MTFLQDLEIAGVIIGDIEQFSANAPITIPPKTIAGMTISGSVVKLPNGPGGTPYQVLSGATAIMAAGFAAAMGMPVSVAEKFKDVWIGYTLQVSKA